METKTVEKKNSGLSGFISALGSNVGVSLSGSKKKEKTFNPYSAENQSQIQEIYDVMGCYQNKTSEQNINVPKTVNVSKGGKQVKFEFENELKADVFDEIVESKGLTNISLDESSKIIEINRKGAIK